MLTDYKMAELKVRKRLKNCTNLGDGVGRLSTGFVDNKNRAISFKPDFRLTLW